MPVSRRGFFDLVGAGGKASFSGAVLAARGLEAELAQAQQQQGDSQTGRGGGAGQGGRGGGQGGRGNRPQLPPGVEEIRINSNENPLGPGKVALDAILNKFPEAGRYPFNSSPKDADLVDTLAKKYSAKPENIVLGAGSQEILKNAVRAFVTPARHLVAAAPTFENCTGFARRMKFPVTEIKVDSTFHLDVEGMIATVRGAGLVFFNNPNNPTATVHGIKTVTDFVERVRRISPDTVILIDEAYHDYVTDPAYSTAIPLALATPNVFVARTFSKAYGMAGMRIGYAIGQVDSVSPLARLKMPYNVSVFGVAATIASLNDPKHIEDERARNTQVRTFTVKALEELGCKSTDSQANFIFTDVGRPAREFRDACAKTGIMVGRDFPPFENSHCRISIGTADEMKKAVDTFREVLRPVAPIAGTKSGGGR
ncbi:MAG TPA: histidinol-phosphate transaminase [Thermoanaerobaculia bacterium]|nr:histidinol-phosphate transaminase [Thermoanaerobaculia bacterium]